MDGNLEITQEELDNLCQQDEDYVQEWRNSLTWEQIESI